MSGKLPVAELIRVAITWAEESMVQMIDGCHDDDPYRAEVKDQLKQLLAYRDRRFGRPVEPTAGAKLVNVMDISRPNGEQGGAA